MRKRHRFPPDLNVMIVRYARGFSRLQKIAERLGFREQLETQINETLAISGAQSDNSNLAMKSTCVVA